MSASGLKPLVLVAESCAKCSQWSRAPGFQQQRGFKLLLGPTYVSAFPALFFFYPNAQFTAALRLEKKGPCLVSSCLVSWSIFLRTKIALFPSSWACSFLTVETPTETAGSFGSRRVWGAGVHVGSLSWHSTSPSRSLWLFLKPSSGVLGVQHAAPTWCPQLGIPISARLSLGLHTSVLLFHLLFGTNS